MFRVLRSLPFTLALAALSIFTACGGSNSTKFRLVNAIPDVPQQQAVDVQIDGKVVGTVSLGGVTPASGYLSVASGSRHLQIFLTGQTTGAYFDGNVNFNSGSNTVVATGSISNNTVVAPLFTDNSTAPTSSNSQLRIIQASPEGLGGNPAVDVYLVAPGGSLPGTSADIADVAYPTANNPYKTFPAGTYDLLLTPAGIASLNIRIPNASFSSGKNYTYVLVDVQNGGQMSQTPVVLNDN
jgi:Domain of unknown function (DUF4397)